ncbi:hypothetical protein Cni_G23322 [Canna indica]|uniref:BZIP domain-containing protein n=1 Tax=Canna indica TaxID=4628 RepID=A0AAQ3KVY8_9LILI|nr:hypothetical protein Cni_G23322 [Canna indica]
MAQLPPKIPCAMSPSWPNLAAHHGAAPPFLPTPPPPAPGSQPSWVDEFLDFSTAKRSHHRRAVSDSVAFLDQPLHVPGGEPAADFDRLDDDQLIRMFSDIVPPPSSLSGAADVPVSSSSTPSDHNSINEDKPAAAEKQAKNESEEAQSAGAETIADPKRVKRILANRQSAQRSRVRKLQYISELERSVTTLQTEVSALSPRVAFLDHQRSLLTLGNSHLKQRIAALAQDKIFKDAHQEALKKEVERLRQVYHQQNLKKMASEPATVTKEKELIS